ncbi:MAG: RHS repeat-associated core domain-containing protein, partial [Bacteroidota bacterium]
EGATHSNKIPETISNGDYVPQYNGNIAGIKWNSQGLYQSQEKLYYFKYDPVNRLTAARYAERSSPTAWGNANGHFSVDDIGYDANGNIERLTRFSGQGGQHAIDELAYSYDAGNQLTSVSDLSGSYEGFADRNTAGNDYRYDDNGNLIEDKNKYITGITYNLLNLPELITFEKDGQTATVQYVYTATGVKLRKISTDYEGKVTTTDYIGGIQYTQVDSEPRLLELIQHDEGRVVPKSDGSGFAYHYDIRDHLGNTRVTFSSETETDTYLATMEMGDVSGEVAAEEEQLFSNINETRQTYLNANTTASSNEVTNPNRAARLNAAQGRVVGPAKSLEVKRGDEIRLEVNAYYEIVQNTNSAISGSVVPFVVSAFSGQGVVDGQTLSSALNQPGALNGVDFLSDEGNGVPKAYLNFLLFDENFVPVALTPSGRDVLDVTDEAENQLPLSGAPQHQTMAVTLDMPTSGYLYVYVSNESDWDINVYFDDLKIEHEHSPVIADESYYPFGLTHNQKPGRQFNNKYLYNGKELQDELGLNWYDYGARMLDASLGRWHVIDPMSDVYHSESPYNYTLNNPINLIDPNGMYVEGAEAWNQLNEEEDKREETEEQREAIKNRVSAALAGNEGRNIGSSGERPNPIGIGSGSAYAIRQAGGNPYDTRGFGTGLMDGVFAGIDNRVDAMKGFIDDPDLGGVLSDMWEGIKGIPGIPGQVADYFGSLENKTSYQLGADVGAFVYGGINGISDGLILGGGLTYGTGILGAGTRALGNNISAAFGPMKQWVRVGPSYSHYLGGHTKLSIRWGASPVGNWRYVNQIGSPTLRTVNQSLRMMRLPLPGWRFKDAGHLHLRK